jgi:hypothetical protein
MVGAITRSDCWPKAKWGCQRLMAIDRGQAEHRAQCRADEAQQQALGEEQRQDARGPRADGRDGADLADALVHRHHHHVHHADQHDGHQHHLDEHRHQVDHARQAGKGRQVGPCVHFQLRLARALLAQAPRWPRQAPVS